MSIVTNPLVVACTTTVRKAIKEITTPALLKIIEQHGAAHEVSYLVEYYEYPLLYELFFVVSFTSMSASEDNGYIISLEVTPDENNTALVAFELSNGNLTKQETEGVLSIRHIHEIPRLEQSIETLTTDCMELITDHILKQKKQ